LFGDIPAAAPVAALNLAPSRPAARRIGLEDGVELARVYVAWPSPALFANGDAEMDLAADILANGRTSRLYTRLIHDRRVAVELGAGQTSRELAGTFQIVASAAPGHTLDELVAAIFDEVAQFAATGPTADEIDRGRARAEAAFVFRLESLGGFGGRADQLNAYNVYLGRPDSFDRDLARYVNAGAGDLQRVVADWLDPSRAVVLSVVPRGRREQALSGTEFVPVPH
jgi:zinc protease